MSVSISHQVQFHDVDCFGIVWHGHYYKYFELARTALYRAHGADDAGHQEFLFPVIESYCRYAEPLAYGQQLTLSASFYEWEYYILIKYAIFDQKSTRRVAYGHTKQAVCDLQKNLLGCVPESVVACISASRVAD